MHSCTELWAYLPATGDDVSVHFGESAEVIDNAVPYMSSAGSQQQASASESSSFDSTTRLPKGLAKEYGHFFFLELVPTLCDGFQEKPNPPWQPRLGSSPQMDLFFFSRIRIPSHPEALEVWRAQFSSLAPVDLKKAMATLGSPNKDMSDSVDARADARNENLAALGRTFGCKSGANFLLSLVRGAKEMDLKLGCAFTRFQTKYFQGKYGDLDTNLVSYGPCQTPTLWFCVRRSDEINAFQPESFYTIDVTVAKAGRDLQAQWDRGQVFDMPIATRQAES